MRSVAGGSPRKTRASSLILTGAVALLLAASAELSSAEGPSSAASSSYASYACSDWIAACREDPVCFACWQAPSTSQSVDCEDRYPEALEGSSCDKTGASNCCDFTDSVSAKECLTNDTMAGYWACVMDDESCSLLDMPCYAGDMLSSDVDSATTATDDGGT